MATRTLPIIAAIITVAASGAASAEPRVHAITRPGQEVVMQPMVDGHVTELLVREGARVQRGQTLVRLDDSVQAARVRLTEKSAEQSGNLKKAQRKLERLRRRLTRLRSARAGSVPKWELEDVGYKIQIAEADVKVATDALAVEREKLNLERTILARYVVAAPFDGEVVELHTDAGATVQRTDKLITVADLKTLKAVGFIPAAAASSFKSGSSYWAAPAKSPERRIVVRLVFIDSRLEPTSQTFRAVFELDNSLAKLPSGTEIVIGHRPLSEARR
ncbi:MAG: efflux RND transporter periplasmic adaptor subunit [Pseudomonadota bacterium]